MKNKKGQMSGALSILSAAAIQFFIFALVLTVAFKGVSTVKAGETGTIAGNITLIEGGLSQFSTNANLVATVIVLSVVILLVSSAFVGGNRS